MTKAFSVAFVFFIAAFETTSSTMALCLYELAKNEVLQKKVQKEIDEIFKAERSISKKVDFELMTEMKYLDCCLNETLRKYPPAPFLIRECGKLYHIPGSKVAIEKGTPVIISTFGLHRDPEFFPNPETFDPERFSDENVHLIKPFTFLPFGNGPRVCIGQRFGKLTAKLGLFLLLQKFNLKLEKEPQGELKFSPQQFVLTLEDEMRMNVSLRT